MGQVSKNHGRPNNSDPQTLRRKFYARTCPEPNSGCLLWLGAVSSNGYGHMCINYDTVSAHKLAWELAGREVPEGMFLLHACDIKACVNVRHLRLGGFSNDVSASNRLQSRLDALSCPEPNSGCRLWLGRMASSGYGVLDVTEADGRGHARFAHRLVWELAKGEIPDALFVLHGCDTAACINIRHLHLGTIADNNAEMAIRWRGRKSKSGLPFGVKTERRGKRYCASLKVDGRNVYLGAFDTPEEASVVAVAAKNNFRKIAT